MHSFHLFFLTLQHSLQSATVSNVSVTRDQTEPPADKTNKLGPDPWTPLPAELHVTWTGGRSGLGFVCFSPDAAHTQSLFCSDRKDQNLNCLITARRQTGSVSA